jgi:FlaA1/EpsC-like NDP-sugar epimerase
MPFVNYRALLALIHDAAAATAAWILAYLFRFNFDVPQPFAATIWETIVWVVPAQIIVLALLGLYRGVWRYAGLHDLKRIVFAVAIAGLVAPVVLQMTRLAFIVPRSVLILDPILLGLLLCAGRLSYRLWKEHQISVLTSDAQPVLVLGADDAATNLIMNLAHSTEWRVVGLLDDNPARRGLLIHGVKVLGEIAALPDIARKHLIAHAIVAMPSATHGERRRVIEICRGAGVAAMTVPSYEDLMSGRVAISQIRRIELDDLLGRDPVVLDTTGLASWLSGRVVLVSGAGGTIGAELCRQIARFRPKQLIFLELNELALYTIEQEFLREFPATSIVCAIGDVKDAERVEQLLSTYRPSVVFHAAAYKHVPLMENENGWQAVLNNVRGTLVLARGAVNHDVEKFVFISTDKAVNPTSVMGASKRLGEMVCQALHQRSETRFVMVRFGNVLGSTGSVIPKFREQIARGGPITVTHPEIKRYFMSVPEAVQLVLQAGLMGQGGEIFVLDMGEPVKITDLARDMIRLSGFSEEDVRITYTGLRPGEKLYEEPLAVDENSLPTPHPKLRIAQARSENSDWLPRLEAWLQRSEAPDETALRLQLAQWLPEYSSQ